MSTSNPHAGTAPEKFWSEDHGGSSTKPFELSTEAVEADARSAFEEARGRAAEREDWDRSRDDRHELTSKYNGGKITDALDTFDQWDEAFRRDPVDAADRFAAGYKKRGPHISKPRPKDEEPPAYLDPKGLDEWHREQAAKNAYRDAQAERDERESFEASAAQRARIKEKAPGRKFSDVLQAIAGIDEGMQSAPDHVAQKVAAMYGAPTSGREVLERQQAGERLAVREQWVDQITASGALPGMEREDVREHMAEFIQHMNKTNQRTGDDVADLRVAHQYASEKLQERAAAEQAKAAAEQAKAAAAKARQASRSVSGSSGGDVRERDIGGGSIEDDARSAYRSLSGNRV